MDNHGEWSFYVARHFTWNFHEFRCQLLVFWRSFHSIGVQGATSRDFQSENPRNRRAEAPGFDKKHFAATTCHGEVSLKQRPKRSKKKKNAFERKTGGHLQKMHQLKLEKMAVPTGPSKRASRFPAWWALVVDYDKPRPATNPVPCVWAPFTDLSHMVFS